jgi:hypothetical protein
MPDARARRKRHIRRVCFRPGGPPNRPVGAAIACPKCDISARTAALGDLVTALCIGGRDAGHFRTLRRIGKAEPRCPGFASRVGFDSRPSLDADCSDAVQFKLCLQHRAFSLDGRCREGQAADRAASAIPCLGGRDSRMGFVPREVDRGGKARRQALSQCKRRQMELFRNTK